MNCRRMNINVMGGFGAPLSANVGCVQGRAAMIVDVSGSVETKNLQIRYSICSDPARMVTNSVKAQTTLVVVGSCWRVC